MEAYVETTEAAQCRVCKRVPNPLSPQTGRCIDCFSTYCKACQLSQPGDTGETCYQNNCGAMLLYPGPGPLDHLTWEVRCWCCKQLIQIHHHPRTHKHMTDTPPEGQNASANMCPTCDLIVRGPDPEHCGNQEHCRCGSDCHAVVWNKRLYDCLREDTTPEHKYSMIQYVIANRMCPHLTPSRAGPPDFLEGKTNKQAVLPAKPRHGPQPDSKLRQLESERM